MAKRQKQSDDFVSSKKEVITLVRKTGKYKNDFDLLRSDPEFEKDIQNIRNKLNIDVETPTLLLDDKNLIGGLLKKYNLSKRWENILTIYILANEFEKMFDPQGTRINLNHEKKIALIEVGMHTTLSDVKNAYKVIMNDLKKGATPRKVIPSTSDRDNYIYELRKQGKNYKTIRKIIEDNYDEKIIEDDLRRIVDKIKRRRKKI